MILDCICKCFQEKFEAEEERLRRAKHISEEKIENDIRKKAEKVQQKMERYKENQEAQRAARLEKQRAEEQHREEVRMKKEERHAEEQHREEVRMKKDERHVQGVAQGWGQPNICSTASIYFVYNSIHLSLYRI